MFEGKNIVIFAAHPDDIECGMGATLNQLKKYDPKIVIFADTVQYNSDKIKDECKNSMQTLGLDFKLYNFEVDNLEKDKVEIRKIIYSYKNMDIIFGPSSLSQHQDHRLIGQAIDDIMLEKTIFFYEDIRSGQNEKINFWNNVSEEDMESKYRMIEKYNTQLEKRHYMTKESFFTMARFRGGQINIQFAEGFEVKRLVRT